MEIVTLYFVSDRSISVDELECLKLQVDLPSAKGGMVPFDGYVVGIRGEYLTPEDEERLNLERIQSRRTGSPSFNLRNSKKFMMAGDSIKTEGGMYFKKLSEAQKAADENRKARIKDKELEVDRLKKEISELKHESEK